MTEDIDHAAYAAGDGDGGFAVECVSCSWTVEMQDALYDLDRGAVAVAELRKLAALHTSLQGRDPTAEAEALTLARAARAAAEAVARANLR
jgi:hypothetical protein